MEVEGRQLRIEHLDRVLYPRTGTTKAELLDYYVRISRVMLPHLRDRLLHMHRYPEGVTGPRFWQKACPEHRPPWLPTDWSQNTAHKSTVCVYSVRARPRPTVSTPVTWEEVEAVVASGDGGALVFEMADVLERVERHGDLFAGVLTTRQALSAPATS